MSSPYSRAGMVQRVAFESVCGSKSTRTSCDRVGECEWVSEGGDSADDGPQVPVVEDTPTPPEKWWWRYVWIRLAAAVVLIIGLCVATSRRNAAHLHDTEGDDIDMSHDPSLTEEGDLVV